MGSVIQFPNTEDRLEEIMPSQDFRDESQHLVFNEAKTDVDLLYVIQLATAAYADLKISEFTKHNATLADATAKAAQLTTEMLKSVNNLLTEGYLL